MVVMVVTVMEVTAMVETGGVYLSVAMVVMAPV